MEQKRVCSWHLTTRDRSPPRTQRHEPLTFSTRCMMNMMCLQRFPDRPARRTAGQWCRVDLFVHLSRHRDSHTSDGDRSKRCRCSLWIPSLHTSCTFGRSAHSCRAADAGSYACQHSPPRAQARSPLGPPGTAAERMREPSSSEWPQMAGCRVGLSNKLTSSVHARPPVSRQSLLFLLFLLSLSLCRRVGARADA